MSDTESPPPELIKSCRGLVRKIATDTRRQLGVQIELEELESAGFEGLLQAHRAYDPDRGIAFTTFAYYRIRGAIIDDCRRLGLVKRRLKNQAKFDEAANIALQQAAESAPDPRAMATTASWIAGAFDELAVIYMMAEGRTPEPASPDPPPEDQAEQKELTHRLRQHLAVLTNEERRMIEGYYIEGTSLSEVARRMGVSKSWASRVHNRALKKLKPLILGKTHNGKR